MRLIDADALANRLLCLSEGSPPTGTALTLRIIGKGLRSDEMFAPTIDAVEVVRCKDCKHWRKKDFQAGNDVDYMEFGGLCPNSRFARYESDFCSFGERRDSDG